MMPHDFMGGTLGQVPMHTIFVCNPPYSWSRDDGKNGRLWRFGGCLHSFCRTGEAFTKQAWQQIKVQALAPTRT